MNAMRTHRFWEDDMNAFYVAVVAIVASMWSVSPAWAQTGAAAAKQMQDTQLSAQKKAREAKSDADVIR